MPDLLRTSTMDDASADNRTATSNASLLKKLLGSRDAAAPGRDSQLSEPCADDEFAQLGKAFSEMIAKRKQAEEELHKSEEYFRALIEYGSDAILVMAADGTYRYQSPVVEHMLGHRAADTGRQAGFPFVHPEDRARAEETFQAVLQKPEGKIQTELRLWRQDGSWRTVSITARNLLQNPAVAGIVINFHDITERKHIEKELQNSEQQFRSIIDSSLDILTILNPEGLIRYNSLSVKQCLGYEQEELVGSDPLDLVHPDDVEKVRQAFTSLLHGAKSVIFPRSRLRHKNGSWPIFESVARPLLNDPQADGILISSRDVTKQQYLESQLALARKLEAIGQLTAGIAHEINTPMQYIGDNARFVRDAFRAVETLLCQYEQFLIASQEGTTTPEHISSLQQLSATTDIAYLLEETPCAIDQLLQGVERVSKIVCAMKEFSHPGGETLAEADLNRAIRTTVEVARNEWKYVAEVELALDPHLPLVPCLLGEFNQVVLNLIVNAAHTISDATDKGKNGKGTITLSTGATEHWAEVRVRDTGMGIPQELRSQIFDPFFTTKEVGKGTGQGLSIAQAVIVEKHKGTLDFETEVGRGTTFILRLPLARAAAPLGDHHEATSSV